MPKYRTRAKSATKRRGAAKRPKKFTRDPRKLLRWAVSGSRDDYGKLRKLARGLEMSPEFLSKARVQRLASITRERMMSELIAETQAGEEHNISGGGFQDALSWVLDKVPWGNWLWPVAAGQSALKAHKGDSMNEVDEEYARLVGAGYKPPDERPYVVEHWRRQAQFDSEYVSVWDNMDGHRVIAVRGTTGTQDLGQDVLVGLTGHSTNRIGDELRQILAATPSESIVDLAAHSLGTSFALEAFNADRASFQRVHETYLYNPAYSPLLRGTSDAYESTESVRYFINLGDPVSIGGIGHSGPSNVVYKQPGTKAGAFNHDLSQWQGSAEHHVQYNAPPDHRVYQMHKAPAVYRRRDDAEEAQYYLQEAADAGDDSLVPPDGVDHVFGEGSLDFGADGFTEALANL